jgi:hypothetical protein
MIIIMSLSKHFSHFNGKSYNILQVFLDILYSFDSFETYLIILMQYIKNIFGLSISNIFNINFMYLLKPCKINHCYTLNGSQFCVCT